MDERSATLARRKYDTIHAGRVTLGEGNPGQRLTEARNFGLATCSKQGWEKNEGPRTRNAHYGALPQGRGTPHAATAVPLAVTL
jgi:hypothetical protein